MSQHFVSNSEESTRMFKNGLFEALSKVHFSVPLFIFLPAIGYFMYLSFTSPHVTLLSGIGFFVLGLFVWTLTEYIMHRFVFHFVPKSKLGLRLHFIFHGVHHDYPRDRLRLVLPPAMSVPLAIVFYFIWKSILPLNGFFPFFAAFIMGYLIYDMIHYAIHHVPLKGKIWNLLKTHHIKHHYVHPSKGYGVSSPIWDNIARTKFPEEKKSVA